MKAARSTPARDCTLTARDVLRLLWEADRYPILGNQDQLVAARLEKEALAKVCNVVASTDDPSEFSLWLTALQTRSLSTHEYDKFIAMLYDLFEPEREHS